MIMGYDYSGGSSNPVGSVAPLGGPGYDIGDTVKAYVSRMPGLEGHPRRARTTAAPGRRPPRPSHAKNISGTKNGASTTVVYGTARQYAADHGRKWDPVEGVAWTVYKSAELHGHVRLRHAVARDLLRRREGARPQVRPRSTATTCVVPGIWALGYDGTRTELYGVLKAKFITDTVPPVISAASISSPFLSPNGDGRMDTVTVRLSVTGHVQFGWVVAAADRRHRSGRRSGPGAHVGKIVAYTWDGRDRCRRSGPGRPLPDHALDRRRLEQPGSRSARS